MAEDVSKTAKTAAAPNNDRPGGFNLLRAVGILAVVVVIAAPTGYLIHARQQKPPARTLPPITVSTTNAVKGDIDESVWALGTVTPVYTAMISPRVDGQLVKVNYTEGQMVTTNDLLAEIDPGPYQAVLLQAQGQLARDTAVLKGAKIDLDRFQQAYVKKAIPKQQVDDQQALVEQDMGTVKYDEGQVANANVQLAYCFIHAPIAGRVGLRLIDPGNVVHAANTNALVVIAQLQPITVEFNVDEKYLPAIQRQLKAGHTMKVEAFNVDKTEKLATGSFQTLDNMIDTGTGTVRIRAVFSNEDLTLFPNQFVNPKLIIDTLNDVTLIPTPAVQRNPTGAFVYVVNRQDVTLTNATGTVVTNKTMVAMREITEGISDPDVTSVEGVEAGEVVVTDNFNKLGDKMEVRLRQPGEGGKKGGPPGGKKKGGKRDKAQESAS